jgi:hypothetical protein
VCEFFSSRRSWPRRLWPRLAWKLGLVALFPAGLVLTGFLQPFERRRVGQLWAAARDRAWPSRGEGPPPPPEDTE